MPLCYRCKRPIEFIRGVVNRFGKLVPLDPDGSPHKHVFPVNEVNDRPDLHNEIILRVKRIPHRNTLAKILEFVKGCTD